MSKEKDVFYCLECNQELDHIENSKKGTSYFACFEEDLHKSNSPLFWSEKNGAPVFEKAEVEVTEYPCTEENCTGFIKKITKQGKKPYWACFEHESPVFFSRREIKALHPEKEEQAAN